jgi:hypothetical protein
MTSPKSDTYTTADNNKTNHIEEASQPAADRSHAASHENNNTKYQDSW